MSATLTAQGIPQALHLLGRLERGAARKSIGRSLAAGARVARKMVRRAAPVRTRGGIKTVRQGRGGSVRVRAPGYLKRNIRMKRLRPRGGVLRYRVAPTATAFYGEYLEKGTRRQRRRRWFGPAVQRSLGAVEAAVVNKARQELARL